MEKAAATAGTTATYRGLADAANTEIKYRFTENQRSCTATH